MILILCMLIIVSYDLIKGGIMVKILSIDPSGTGTTGICLIEGNKITFQEFLSPH
jgi:hypothetical protein